MTEADKRLSDVVGYQTTAVQFNEAYSTKSDSIMESLIGMSKVLDEAQLKISQLTTERFSLSTTLIQIAYDLQKIDTKDKKIQDEIDSILWLIKVHLQNGC